MVETNSGVRLDQLIRTSACGTWWSASTGGGRPIGLLQLDPALAGQPAARDRAAEAVLAVRELNPTGVLRTTELVVEAGRAWLVVATLPAPTVADLVAAAITLDPGCAAGVALDAAAALRELHAAGLAHGDVAADTVALTPGGAGTLIEVGVLAALRATPADLGHDAAGWASVTAALADLVEGAPAESLRAAAATAANGDLTGALRALAAAAADWPGVANRDPLVAVFPRVVQPAAQGPRQPAAPRQSSVDGSGGAVRLRFGPGVPAAPAAPPVAAVRRRWSRLWAAAAAVAVVVIGAGAGWLLLVR